MVALPAEHRDQLIVDDLDDLLPRVQPRQQVRARGALADAGDELLDDTEVDVGLEQREPDLAQRDVEVGLGDLGLAAQALGDALQAGGERFEHGRPGTEWTMRALSLGCCPPANGCPF